MKVLRFKCTLLSDVILNQKSATEGTNVTLDFIPGNCFLGIVAGALYNTLPGAQEKNLLFHSGKVRFGDAHPSKKDVRGLKVPALMFYPKLSSPSKELYIHSRIVHWNEEMLDKQLKQCREGFYVFGKDEAQKVNVEKNFSIKSAYDRKKRRAEDSKMYGYESLPEGLVMIFEVEMDEEAVNWSDAVSNALVGRKRIGRSRTAQYGLVKIERMADISYTIRQMQGDDIVYVYADGRLIFLDESGLPTFQPSAEQLGLEKDAEILWDKSQIRTFQYAPWNFKRQAFDMDRCGIEKGSVFVVKSKCPSELSRYVGSFQNEGFGKVIYNPDFLDATENGKSHILLLSNEDEKSEDKECKEVSDDLLITILRERKKKEDLEQKVYESVNEFVDRYACRFVKEERFASQWGTIRLLAMKCRSKEELERALFAEETGYLEHGVAAEKWNENKRKNVLKEFIVAQSERVALLATINLAAEMAKKCRRK